MQLMPKTASSLQVQDSFHPEKNIEGGVRYLRYLLQYFNGSLPLALAAYNAGENAVIRYGGIPPYPETQTYVQRVLSYLDRYK
jgi:soluble lytic murein transglycosylase-like protein